MFALMSSPRAQRAVAFAFAGALVASGCTSSPSATPPTTTDDGSVDAGALPTVPVPLVGAEGIDGVEVELGIVSRDTLEQLIIATGTQAALPGVLQPVIVLDREITSAGRSFATELLDLPEEPAVAATFGRSRPMALDGGTELAVMGTGLLSTIIEQALDHAASGSTSNAEPPEQPSENHVTVDGGNIDVRYADSATTDLDGSTVTVGTEVAGVLGACPTANGDVGGELSVKMTLDGATAAGAVGLTYTMVLDIDGNVDDEAHLTGHDMTVSGSASGYGRVENDGSAAIEGFFIEGGSTTSYTGTALGGDLAVASLTGPGVTRVSSAVTGANAQAFINSQHTIAFMLSSLVLHRAEAVWRSGACIDVDLQTSADPTQLDPFQTIELSVDATSAEDGAKITGSVGATVVAGAADASPSTSPALPATIALTASNDASPSTVDIEVRSRRGIGRASVDLSGVQAFSVDGALDVFRATGAKCGGPAGAWQLDLTASFDGASFTGTISFDLDPATLTGRFALTGTTTGGGISIPQQGSGDVSFVEDATGARQLVFEGAAWAGGPSGTHSIPVLPGESCS